MNGFGARLTAAVAAHGPLCVGIDPHRELLEQWGLSDDPNGLERFSRAVVEAMAGAVAVVKPQSAFFERHGSAGIAVLEKVLADARAAELLVVLDVKRGDIGSTMGGYAQAYLADGAPLAADAITVSPYLGFGSLGPALSLAAQTGRGLFVLARTSNPEGAAVQLARDDATTTVAQSIVDAAAGANRGETPVGSVGVVVGANRDHGLKLAELNGPVLAPGLGAQGGSPDDIARRFAELSGVVLPSASRSVLGAGPGRSALRDAAITLSDQLVTISGQSGEK
ncbi:MAG TPA: orotidine-5'-phosphate decarboxylase [Pseudonocardia sp.]|nr:orotidine-5'-phosphate decarboxylase [Pseudonocardia sp.]